MLIPQTNAWQPGFKKRTIKREIKVGPVSLKFLIIALVAVGALLYLAQTTFSNSQQYEITQLNRQKAELAQKTHDLEVSAARLKALNTIEDSAPKFGLASADANQSQQ